MRSPPRKIEVDLLGGKTVIQFVPPPLKDEKGKLCWGLCDAPERKPVPRIRIDKTLRGIDALDTLIHEALHRAGWHIDEDFVEAFATQLATVLWGLGYRAPWDQ